MIVGLLFVVLGVTAVLYQAGQARRRSAASGLSVALLRLLARVAPPDRRGWIDAMLAEHDAIDDPAQRRRFARGCLRSALLAPAGRDNAALIVDATVGLGVTAAATLAGYGLAHYPGLRDDWTWIVYLTALVVGLAGYTVAGLSADTLGSPAARRVGVLVAMPAIVLSWAAIETDRCAVARVHPERDPQLPDLDGWRQPRRRLLPADLHPRRRDRDRPRGSQAGGTTSHDPGLDDH
jgi:hypothetical protein